jgi:hypothetical protein
MDRLRYAPAHCPSPFQTPEGIAGPEQEENKRRIRGEIEEE